MVTPATAVSGLRKSGSLEEALELAQASFVATPNDAYLQRAYGWVIYDLVKREVQEYEAERIVGSKLANSFNQWIGEYKRLDQIERPGMLHSRLLTQVLKVSRAWPNFLRFARWWDPTSLRDEDKISHKNENGRSLPNLEIRLLYAIGRSAVAKDNDPELRVWAEGAVDQGLEQHPGDGWLHYYKSQLLIEHGRGTEARTFLLSVAKRKQRASWVWSLLGQTFENEDRVKAVTCFFRAIQLAGQPSEVVKTRVRLAYMLAATERFHEAAHQVRTALKMREAARWKIPEELARLAHADWYRGLAMVKDFPPEPDVAEAAEEILFGAEAGEVTTRLGIIDNQNPEKSLAHAAFSPTEGVVLHYNRFKDASEMPIGTFVEVGLVGNPPHPTRMMRSTEGSLPGFCELKHGEFTIKPGNKFGFVITEKGERVFIPPAVVMDSRCCPGEPVHCLAVLGEDKKRAALGWKALEIRPLHDAP